MVKRTITIAFLSIVVFHTNCTIMRNKELISKMVSQFQEKDRTSENHFLEPKEPKPEKKTDVVSLMQHVLCRNFPTIPCGLIAADPKLKALIQKSVQQIKYKKMTLERTTAPPSYQLTLFPTLNEDLSNFIQVSDTEFPKAKYTGTAKKKAKKSIKGRNFWSHESPSKLKEPRSRSAMFGSRMKMRKFYPHKIKYKDKNLKADIGRDSDEKLSMSVETPEYKTRDHRITRRHFSFREEDSDPPVWRIDYTKHGEPSINMFEHEADNLKGKLIQTGPNVVAESNGIGRGPRKDVLHPDVFIEKNFVRKSVAEMASDDIE